MRRIIIPTAVIAITITLLLSLTMSAAQFVPQKPSQWYTIEPWEVAVCSKWGGRAEAQETNAVVSGLTGFGPFTYSILGKKRHLLENNQTLYTYAYYVESYSAQLTYSIDLYNPATQRRYPLAGSTLGPGNGVQNTKAEYIDEDFTHIRIIHQLGQVLFPLVQEGDQ